MSIGQSGGFSSSSAKSHSGSQNIGQALLANLFGQGVGFGPQGLQFSKGAGPTGSRVFEAGQMANPTAANIGEAQSGGFGDIFGGGSLGGSSFVQGLDSRVPARAPFDPNQRIGSLPKGGFAPQVFAPQDFMSLRGLTDPVAGNQLQTGLGGLLGGSLGFADRALPAIQSAGLGALGEGLDTGFRTDISPITAQRERALFRETLPQIAETFAGLAPSGFSTDFARNVMGAGTDLQTELGAIQAELDESANARRAAFAQVAPQVGSGLLNLGTDVGAGFLDMGNALFETQRFLRPEQQLIRNLTNLFSLAPQTTGAMSKQKSFSMNQSSNVGI